MTTITIGHGAARLRSRPLAMLVGVALLVWCACVLAVAWSSPTGGGPRPTVVLTPEPRPAGY